MTDDEKKIVPQIILADLKYLSVRQLFFDWFFPSGAEIAVQLLDSTIKLYLRSIGREDLVKEIRSWGGDESHNLTRIIDKLRERGLARDFLIAEQRQTLTNLHKSYQLRYLDSLEKMGGTEVLLKDIIAIDYVYSYFRNLINISPDARKETFINKALLEKKDLPWGENKKSLAEILYRQNEYFKP